MRKEISLRKETRRNEDIDVQVLLTMLFRKVLHEYRNSTTSSFEEGSFYTFTDFEKLFVR